jgi:membrane fusion protein (multidrug efflux system)
LLLLLAVVATAGSLAAWKHVSLQNAATASANQPEPIESVTVAVARPSSYRPTTTAIGTMMALRSITLRNELPGTVRQVMLTPGQIVEAGTVLVALDVSVEEAELQAQRAQAALAQSVLARRTRLRERNTVSEEELDRAKAERDVALAQIARTKAVIERKTIRAPFRARVGIADVHPGQYLNEGTRLTTLQGVDRAAHVDFWVEQRIAAALQEADTVEVLATTGDASPLMAKIVAIDARVDPTTRNGSCARGSRMRRMHRLRGRRCGSVSCSAHLVPRLSSLQAQCAGDPRATMCSCSRRTGTTRRARTCGRSRPARCSATKS